MSTTETHIGTYRCTRRLGAGGQATAWLAKDPGQGDQVVVKVLHLEAAENWKLVELFERSARVLESLNHPRIPAYRDHFELADDNAIKLCLVRDFVAGESLQELIEADGSFSEEEIISFAIQLLEVLSYLHGREPAIVHRDIKPANIVRDENGYLHLMDFGVVQAEVARETGGSTVVGTAGYVAPEQLMGRALPASDIYALGVTLAHLMTRKPPIEFASSGFELDIAAELRASAELAYLIGRMTRADIEEREGSAERLLEAFRDLSLGKAIIVRSSTLPSRLPRGSCLEISDTGTLITIRTPKNLRRFLRSRKNRMIMELVFPAIYVCFAAMIFSALATSVSSKAVIWALAGVAYLAFLGFLSIKWRSSRIVLRENHLEITVDGPLTSAYFFEGLSNAIPVLSTRDREVPYDVIRRIRFAPDDRGNRRMLLECTPGADLMHHVAIDYGWEDGVYVLELGWTQGEEIWLANLINARLAQHRELSGSTSAR